MDVSYSLALHMLIMISESEMPLSSAQIAGSAGVNATQIRKIAGLLRQSGLIESRRGIQGFRLTRCADEITLLEVYRAVYECEKVRLLSIHRNPNDECLVGKYIRPVLTDVFGAAEANAAKTMNETTLASVIGKLREAVQAEGAEGDRGE